MTVFKRKWFKRMKSGEKTYRVDRQGLIWEYVKISDGEYRKRCLTPTREGLPQVIHIDPPAPFKTWGDYNKSIDEKSMGELRKKTMKKIHEEFMNRD